jgi:predicted DNA-binding ribbon-helix-helix protein
MKSSIIKRSVVIDGHKTSISLEDAFWRGLKEIARAKQATLSKIVAEIDKTRQQGNLSSAIRLFVLDRVRTPETTLTNGLQVEVTLHGTANCEFDQQTL